MVLCDIIITKGSQGEIIEEESNASKEASPIMHASCDNAILPVFFFSNHWAIGKDVRLHIKIASFKTIQLFWPSQSSENNDSTQNLSEVSCKIHFSCKWKDVCVFEFQYLPFEHYYNIRHSSNTSFQSCTY